jgi:hypothetical protein
MAEDASRYQPCRPAGMDSKRVKRKAHEVRGMPRSPGLVTLFSAPSGAVKIMSGGMCTS